MNCVHLLTFRALRLCGLALRISCSLAFAMLCFTASSASGSFIRDYALVNFTLTNNNADGYANSLFGGDVVILYGGNNGSGLSGTTDLVVHATADGIVSFEYSYSSFDDPGYDWAGYLLKGNFVILADTNGQGGLVQFPVLTGDSFGFRVLTDDNTVEPGILTISRFSAPGSASVPEPSTLWLVAAACLPILAARRHPR